MRHIDVYRNSDLIAGLLGRIRRQVDPARTYRIMEVCGGHTHAFHRFGLPDLLPSNVELIHGPGCPVCVLPRGRIDQGLAMAEEPGVILTAFGDMMRVPGTLGSPLRARASGRDVRAVYSPIDALRLAEANPDRRVVFFAIGFETTAPATALTVLLARRKRVENVSVFCNHVRIVPALEALLAPPGAGLDGMIGPGHVSTVIGSLAYEFIPRDHGIPVVVSGFEPLDLLQAVLLLIERINEGRADLVNAYRRAVPDGGNAAALAAMDRVFEERDSFEWRGLGRIPWSALRLREEFADLDAERWFPPPDAGDGAPDDSPCGRVLRGLMRPTSCPLFGGECSPEHPIGALMVSSEGACAAYHAYRRGEPAAT
ncbi:hydrogenase formation protein HypD [Tautonia sociabilis]|uniref:Hydrogenase formation protein HypD n=1 Tax=Tautonia sociabilis TaxID=2080755 RepID=A0A432MGB1_9BACT|nr:hydrogenase formation protein HypD [Tautonia sociabilis]RUL85634.1 hydrogenase formation protein HypD [Tautonia sociabilis]